MKARRGIAVILLATLVMAGCGKSGDVRDLNDSGKAETDLTEAEQAEEVSAEETAETDAQTEDEGTPEEAEEETGEEAAAEADSEHPVLIQVDIINRNITYCENTDYGYREIARCEVDSVVLADESASLYPELAKVLEDKADSEKETVIAGCEAYKADYDDSEIIDHDYFNSNNMTLEDLGERKVVRADSNILSVCNSWQSYTGGVHGFYGKGGDNYDTQTGKELKFSDVVTDSETFFSMANEKKSAMYGDGRFMTDISEYMKEYSEDADLSWWVDYQGVTIYFGPYLLGSYADGACEIKILFSEAPELFNPKYTFVPDSYVMPIESKTGENPGMLLDMEGDGLIDYIYCEEFEDPEYEYSLAGIDVSVNGENLHLEDIFYSSDNYVVFNEGKYYFVSFKLSEGDWTYCTVADLTNMKDLDSKTEGDGFASYGYTNENPDVGYDYYDYKSAVFTDPDCLRMNVRTDFLGTMNGNTHCKLDGNGNLTASSEPVLFTAHFAFEAKKEVSCKQVDFDGNVIGDAKLKAGAYYAVVRGDGKTYADVIEVPESELEIDEYSISFKDEYRGRTIKESDVLYRLEGGYSDDSYYLYIGDEPVEDLFDKILYAG